MRGVVYCNKCGCSNPRGMKRCQTCNCKLEPIKDNPITSADFANRKMAIFDIDNTILDPEQRFIDARRAGVIDKDGAPKTKGGWKKRGEFLYKEDRLLKDRVMPNSLDLIEHLMEQGYVIAYCTARPFTYYEATKYQLEQKRFPLFQNGVGEDLLFCKRSMGQKTPLYKKGVVETLQAQYDVRLFFDDQPENLAAALQADVPGVYASVKEYYDMVKGVKRNGQRKPHVMETKGDLHVVGTDSMNYASELLAQEMDRRDAEGQYSDNPAMYSKKSLEMAYQSIKGTKIQTEPGPGMKMCGTCVYMCQQSAKCKKWTEIKGEPVYVIADWYCGAWEQSIKGNPIKRGSDSKGSYYRWGKNQKYYYKTGSKTSRERARKKAHNQAKAAFAGGYRGKYNPGHAMKVKDILIDEGGASGLKPLMKAFPKGTSEMKAREMLKSIPDVYLHPAGDYILMNPRRNGEEYSSDYMVPRDVDTLGKAADRIEDTYYEGLEVPEWWKSKLSVTADRADSLADAVSYVADNPRSNPPKDKIEKGKKLYKHMNGKDPAKTETKTIDIGDVWYQVGEGGCWEIGYMSGKETGSSSQKYRHTFNEETKNGDFPKLYATIPDKGKPMLIITGGTWKIKTDEDGIAWIYD